MLPWGGELRASPAGSATLPGCLQLALVTWWQGRRISAWTRTSTTACPVIAMGPGLTAPAAHWRGRGDRPFSARWHLALFSRAPQVTFEDGYGRAAAAPPRGRQAVPELRQLLDGDSLQGKNGPEPERGLEGRRILAERGGVGFDRKESTNLSFSNQQPPSPSRRTLCPVGKLCPLGFLSVAPLST